MANPFQQVRDIIKGKVSPSSFLDNFKQKVSSVASNYNLTQPYIPTKMGLLARRKIYTNVSNGAKVANTAVKATNKWLGLDKQVLPTHPNKFINAAATPIETNLRFGNALLNLINVPSYALGGILKEGKAQLSGESPKGIIHPAITGAYKGIRDKQALFEEAPKALGVDPTSLGGIALGMTAEVASPGFGELGKAKKLIASVDNLNWMKGAKNEEKIQALKNSVSNLLSESPAQTKFRRELNLKPEEVYQNSMQVKDEFQKFNRVKPSSVVNSVFNLKDITPTEKGFKDVYRVFEKSFGKEYPTIKRAILDPFDDGKRTYVQMFNHYSDGLKKNVVDLGIKKGSKESAAVQLYGEGKLNVRDLVNNYGKFKAEKIVRADKFFRHSYDELLNIVNATRRQLYPHNPEMIIPKRNDYYRHFQDLTGLDGLKNIFENSFGIDPNLVGVSDFTTPKSKWLSFAQKRKGDQTTIDAVSGFMDYLQKAAYSSQIDPHILQFRKLQSELIEKSGEDTEAFKSLNNTIEFLEDFANDLAGKTNPIDRGIQKYIPGGRKTFQAINWINGRVKANVILGNLSSSVSQIFNAPQGIAKAGVKNFLAGAGDTVLSSIRKSEIEKSGFISERYLKTNQFDVGIMGNAKKFASWITGVLDEFGTKSIWHGMYKKAVSEGIPEPVRYADEWARKLVGGRGIGEVPLVQKSKVVQLIAPFQLEVQNLWHVMGEMVDKKQFGQLAKLFIYNYMFNSVSEKVTGRRVTFDPIDAMLDAAGEVRDEPVVSEGLLKAGGRLGGEVLSNKMFGSSLAQLYPEYGTGNLPSRKDLFGDADPTRFGSGLFTQGIQDPIYKLLPPFGGNQLKKTIGGVSDYVRGRSETPTGRIRFEMEKTPGNLIKSATFGSYATGSGRVYVKSLGKSDAKIALDKYNKLAKKDPEQAKQNLILIKKNNPNLFNEMIKVKKDQTLKVTSSERNLRTLPVKDGSRARSLIKVIKKYERGSQELKDLLARYQELGILTPEVIKQLKEMKKQGIY